MVSHCSNNALDRSVGAYWEQAFCKMAGSYGFTFSPLQLGRTGSAVASYRDGTAIKHLTLPDVAIWTAPGQYHEIKHKKPTTDGSFGLEVYRFDALKRFADTTRQAIMYTIHNPIWLVDGRARSIVLEIGTQSMCLIWLESEEKRAAILG